MRVVMVLVVQCLRGWLLWGIYIVVCVVVCLRETGD